MSDDTAAIQRAICENQGGRMVYLPAGVYVVSSTLEGKDCKGVWAPFVSIVGQARDKVTIRLREGASGFSDPAQPRAVIYTASGHFTGPETAYWASTGGSNEAFRNFVENLTVDTGANPGAIGIDFQASNIGAIRAVAIKGQGVSGLRMTRRINGPLLVKDLSVDGFARGIEAGGAENGLTLEHIRLSGQREVGISNDVGGILSIRDLQSNNSVPVLRNGSEIGFVTLIEASLSGGSSQTSAILVPWDANRYHRAQYFLRNVVASGYGAILKDGDEAIGTTRIAELSSGGQAGLFRSALGSLDLPVREFSQSHDNDLSRWANVLDYGARTTRDDGSFDFGGDDSDGIQRAIDSGKSTVYLPAGTYFLWKPIIIRGNVRRLIGRSATLAVGWNIFNNASMPKAMIRVEEGAAPDVTIEGISVNNLYSNDGQGPQPGLIGVEHATGRPLLLKDFGCCNLSGSYRNSYRGTSDAGPLFIENVSASHWLFANSQSVWARQFNPEGDQTHAVNSGATLWVLGFKTEGAGTVVDTAGGGRTEILGGVAYSNSSHSPTDAVFTSTDSSLSLSFATTAYSANGGSSDNWPSFVRQTVSGTTRNLGSTIGGWRGFGSSQPLFVSRPIVQGMAVAADGIGLTGQYFDKTDFTDVKLTRVDDTVSFDWKSWFQPIPEIPRTTNYSIRWSGQIEVPVSGAYQFSSVGDYYMPLWIDGQQIVGTQTFGGTGTINLNAGQKYSVRLDFKGGGSSRVELRYRGPGASRLEVVPRSQLFPR